MSGRLSLEIGCGEQKVGDNSIGIDIGMTQAVDITADACQLPFKNGCFEHVYASHLIKHFSHREVNEVLREWVKLLKQVGIKQVKRILKTRGYLGIPFLPDCLHVKGIKANH